MYVIRDLLYALRLLKKTPKFTALTIIVLCGGLAVSLFTFAFLYTFTSKPLPIEDQGTLYRASLLWHSEKFGESRYLEAYEAARLREHATVFSEHGVWQNKTVSVSLGNNQLIVEAASTTPDIFKVSRTQPLLGRTLEASDSLRGSTPVAVISYAIWQGQFGGDPEVIGKTFYVSGQTTEVVGVMPQGYRFPISHQLWLPMPAQILNPVILDREKVEFFARLKPGVSVEQAQTQFFSITSQAFNARKEKLPKGIELIRADMDLYQRFDIDNAMRLTVLVLNVVAFFILLLAAINIGNLLFARAIQRSKESAIRTAIGAPHWRLVSQLMWEGVLITLAGTALAVVLVAWLLNFIDSYFHTLMGNELPFWYRWELDITVFVAAVVFALFTIFVASFLPAYKAARQDFNMVLRDGTRGAQSISIGRLSRFLLVTQIATITLIMVLGTAISFKVNKATDLELGYDYDKLYFAIAELPLHNYPTDEKRALFFERMQRQLSEDAAFSDAGIRFSYKRQPVALSGVDYKTDADKPKATIYTVIGSTEFMGPKLLAGRRLDTRDRKDGAKTAMVSQSMANRLWGNDSPLGKQLQVTLDDEFATVTVVGVVSDITNNPLEKPALYDELYLAGYQFPKARGTIFFKRAVDAAVAEDRFFRILNGNDSQLNIVAIEDWEMETSATAKMVATFRDTVIMSGLFALILAMTGIYGLTAFSVEKRAQEVGVRRALGATDKDIIMLFIKQSSKLLLAGLLIGGGLSSLMLIAVSSVLALTTFAYASIFVAVLGSLVLVVLVAVIIPSRKAVFMQPSEALRCE
ncbi:MULTISPECIES: ABC transporter permease [Pseudoalteromonas]|uniref:Permease n=1 Tax=Pseudoalteromonas amylolytica TaxID=1859457 RepID=A0A1S1N1V9_9GAMM|nr:MULTISPECIES: ABC transporter permease [Pseudoalteromonas]MCF6434842.1 ABC transporter permease [Pseudoalteromonas sp. MMG022]OHU90796.1 hypothetical protein BFC16_04135 [Pseudoalteromonas sp. JW3]OHU92584.1 hypothetical protein BET10_03755 [Pseudoalteromonas amylolytica]